MARVILICFTAFFILSNSSFVLSDPIICPMGEVISKGLYDIKLFCSYTDYDGTYWDDDGKKPKWGEEKLQQEVVGYAVTLKDVSRMDFYARIAHGILDDLEVSLKFPLERKSVERELARARAEKASPVKVGSGLADISINMKYCLLKEEHFTFSCGFGIELPTGDESPEPAELPTGSGSTDFFISAYFMERLGLVNCHGFLEYKITGRNSLNYNLGDIFRCGISSEYPIRGGFSLLLELMAELEWPTRDATGNPITIENQRDPTMADLDGDGITDDKLSYLIIFAPGVEYRVPDVAGLKLFASAKLRVVGKNRHCGQAYCAGLSYIF